MMSCINVVAGISLQNTVNLYRIGHFYFAKTGHYYIAFTLLLHISGGYVKFAYELTATKTLDSPYYFVQCLKAGKCKFTHEEAFSDSFPHLWII